MDTLVQRLKRALVSNLLNIKQDKLDTHYMTSSCGSFTRRELADEIDKETEVGKDMMEKIITLSIDLLERKKEKI